MIHLENEIKAILIANAGILIQYQNTRILIDGIHFDKRHYFSPMSEKALNEFLSGKGQFANIDFLLFTHHHVDHFSPKYTMEYLKNNMVRTVFMPKKGDGKCTELKNFMAARNINARLLDMPFKKRYTYLIGNNIGITVFNTVHMGEQFKDVENYCYILTIENKNILFTADAEYNAEYYEQSLKNIPIHTVFVNPLYLNNVQGRSVITQTIKPHQTIIYHIPFQQDDRLEFRKMVKKDIDKYKNQFFTIKPIQDEFQEIIL